MKNKKNITKKIYREDVFEKWLKIENKEKNIVFFQKKNWDGIIGKNNFLLKFIKFKNAISKNIMEDVRRINLFNVNHEWVKAALEKEEVFPFFVFLVGFEKINKKQRTMEIVSLTIDKEMFKIWAEKIQFKEYFLKESISEEEKNIHFSRIKNEYKNDLFFLKKIKSKSDFEIFLNLKNLKSHKDKCVFSGEERKKKWSDDWGFKKIEWNSNIGIQWPWITYGKRPVKKEKEIKPKLTPVIKWQPKPMEMKKGRPKIKLGF